MGFWRKDKHVVALEVGTCKIAVAVGSLGSDGGMNILGTSETASAGVRKGEIVDPKAAAVALRDAILAAETKIGVTVDEVNLVLSGSHLQCEERVTVKEILREDNHIIEADVAEVHHMVQEQHENAGRFRVTEMPRSYSIDGGEPVQDPVGMIGRRLEAVFMVVHGVQGRLQNFVKCVHEPGIAIVDYALGPVVAAEAILNEDQKQSGALVIDMGGGLTHYAFFCDGRLEKMGVVGIGGDHVTQDISRAFHLPLRQSEQIKCSMATVDDDGLDPEQVLQVPASNGFAGKNIYAKSLATVCRLRVEETLEIIREELGEQVKLFGAGILLTGGGSRLKGVESLVSSVFGKPSLCARMHHLSGDAEDLSRPELSAVLGMLLTATRKEAKTRKLKSPLGMFKRAWEQVRMFAF